MVRVWLRVDARPTWMDEGVPAVPAGPYVDLDEGQGGITRADVREDDVHPLGSFTRGDELFIESDVLDDVLDDTDEATARETRIWWRASVGLEQEDVAVGDGPQTPRGGVGGSASAAG